MKILHESLATLYTLKGSPIQRCKKYGVGKFISGKIYAHKNYLDRIFTLEELNKYGFMSLAELQAALAAKYKGIYTCFCYSPKEYQITLSDSPDFDYASEPIVGNICKIDLTTMQVISRRFVKQIWHHKWLWVDDDYTGFDTKTSWEWSKKWLSVLTEPANGSNINNWMHQLYRFGLLDDFLDINC